MTLTFVPGITIGHANDPAGETGCTVVLGPFRGAVHVSGMATGSREFGVLHPEHLVPTVDAILLTGGSAFGLAAADGVMTWLAERGRGFATGIAPVPIVPAAVIFDLAEGRPRPDSRMGYEACQNASDAPVPTGRVGAGAGATIGKVLGPAGSVPGGLGSAALEVGGHVIAALTVLNPVGDVLDASGGILAGARTEDGALVNARNFLMGARAGDASDDGTGPRPGENTTLSVIATDAPLGAVDLCRLARMAATALPRRINPVGTPFDGDVTFAVSPTEVAEDADPALLLALGNAAAAALERAIEVAAGG